MCSFHRSALTFSSISPSKHHMASDRDIYQPFLNNEILSPQHSLFSSTFFDQPALVLNNAEVLAIFPLLCEFGESELPPVALAVKKRLQTVLDAMEAQMGSLVSAQPAVQTTSTDIIFRTWDLNFRLRTHHLQCAQVLPATSPHFRRLLQPCEHPLLEHHSKKTGWTWRMSRTAPRNCCCPPPNHNSPRL